MSELAPIALFVYNRPMHTQRVIDALKCNYLAAESDLFIFMDGCRNKADKKESDSITKVREIIYNIKGFNRVNIFESDINKGLKRSIIDGLEYVLKESDRIIVLEDDIITSVGFLKYMNDALELYKNDQKVMHIAAHIFHTPFWLPGTFFYNETTCWGWGTWRRAWVNYCDDATLLLNNVKKVTTTERFDFQRGYTSQLNANINKEIDTWAVKWHTSVYLKEGLCLHPKKPLTINIGFDGSGQNCLNEVCFNKITDEIKVKRIKLKENRIIYLYLKYYFFIRQVKEYFKYRFNNKYKVANTKT